jgi:hypothetical protein
MRELPFDLRIPTVEQNIAIPELINEVNAELQSMGSNDLIYITVYKDFLTFQILRGEFNKPKNKK